MKKVCYNKVTTSSCYWRKASCDYFYFLYKRVKEMLKVDDYVVYKKDTCKVKEIKKMNNKDYYVLIPVSDSSLKINVPVDNPDLKKLMTKEEIEYLIKKMPTIEPIVSDNDKMIECEYKSLLATNDKEDLIKIIKTTYLRNKERLDNNKKIGERDESYLKKAEQYLYNEMSIVLDMSFDDVKDYVINRVMLLEEN